MKMLKRIIVVGLLFSLVLSTGCSFTDTEPTTSPPSNVSQTSVDQPLPDDEHHFNLRVLVLRNSQDENYLNIYQHLVQTRMVGTTVVVKNTDEITSLKDLSPYDLVYPDRAILKSDNFQDISNLLIDYVKNGGKLFLEHQLKDGFPNSFLGIKEFKPVEGSSIIFQYPEETGDLKELQGVWKRFASDYNEYQGLNPTYHIHHKEAAVPSTAEALVTQDNLAFLTANTYGKGQVLWSNNFMPNTLVFITQLDHQKNEPTQKYFHFGYTTANRLFREAILDWVAKEKYGYAIKKVYGPYGRPALSWQNHYEALRSFDRRDMIRWTDILNEHNQIPSFSLVRGSYNWGRWTADITVQLNEGTNTHPIFPGQLNNSFYGSGQKLMLGNDYMSFGIYPAYKTLMSDIDLPFRSYSQLVDFDEDGRMDFIVGKPNGQVVWIRNESFSDTPSYQKAQNLYGVKVNKYASPNVVDLNGDGKLDMLVGDGDGYVNLFLNTGNKYNNIYTYRNYGKLQVVNNGSLKVSGVAAPFTYDWDEDGITDLLVGDSEGTITFFKGELNGNIVRFTEGKKLMINHEPLKVNKFSVPAMYDIDGDFTKELLVGNGDGTVEIYERTSSGLTSVGAAQGKEKNFFGSNKIKVGHNSVPIVADWNNDGKNDLIIGGLEYGLPYPIDSDYFPFKDRLIENIRYVQERFIPLYPHIFVPGYLSREEEEKELELHKKAFNSLGIPWDQDMGANHHTWTVNQDANQTFSIQQESGIWWNFGWRPPDVGMPPKDGREYLWVMPYLWMDKEEIKPFIIHEAAANLHDFPKTYDSMAYYDIPLTYFEHIEFSLEEGTLFRKNLNEEIDFLNNFRWNNDYNFMTEQQMARSLINNMYTKVDVSILEGKDGFPILVVDPDLKDVPVDKAKEYLDTLGLVIELGEKYKGKNLKTNSNIYTYKNKSMYLGVIGETTIQLVDQLEDEFHIIRSNGPIKWSTSENGTTIKLLTKGMQNIKLYSPEKLEIKGDNLRITEKNNTYDIIHFGDITEIKITKKPQ